MRLYLCLCILFLLSGLSVINHIDLSLKINDVPAKDMVAGIIQKLPLPNGLFDRCKNFLLGYHWDFVSSFINSDCLSADMVSSKYLPHIDKIQFQLRTSCNRYDYPILKANEMWTSQEFDPKNKFVLFVTGLNTFPGDDVIIAAFSKAYNCRGGVNFVAVDVGTFIDTLHIWWAYNTNALGMYIAESLKQLAAIMPIENIHLIGHSLGVNIVGAAGRYFQMKTNKSLPHISALDPTKPFVNNEQYFSGLQRGDADFIDVIHTSLEVLEKPDPMGDVDFYPGGFDPISTGCVGIMCAQARSWMYYVETIFPGNEKSVKGTRCSSLTIVPDGECVQSEVTLGYAVPTNAKGSYTFEVRPVASFNDKDNNNCGACQQ